MVEHADFLRQPHRVIERQQIDERTQTQIPRTLRERGHEDARRRRHTQRSPVVLAHVIAIEAALIVQLRQFQAVIILLSKRQAAAVILVEYAELNHVMPSARSRLYGGIRWLVAPRPSPGIRSILP